MLGYDCNRHSRDPQGACLQLRYHPPVKTMELMELVGDFELKKKK